jgi:putative hydrolase of the HAD superfamily
MPADLSHIDVWVFDLDNTLYPAASNLFAQVSQRMGLYISRRLDIDLDAARRLQKAYFRSHGTTLRGLMTEHGIDPHEFMDFVHDIDLGVIAPDDALDHALAGLPGRKLIHTNGSVSHAERVLARLGVAKHFDGIFDIAAGDWRPKPEPSGYDRLIQRFAIEPMRAAMIEDMARNLKPAAERGMATIWLRSGIDWAAEEAEADYVQHRIDDLAPWLAAQAPHAR